MSYSDIKITQADINNNNVRSASDILIGNADDNKAVFDKLPEFVAGKHNELVDALDEVSQDDTEAIDRLSAEKVNVPKNGTELDFGEAGQMLTTKGNGETQWEDAGQPTDEQTQNAINNWLDAHPEATTTVQDESLTYKKLVKGTLGYVTPEMFGAVGDGVTDDAQALQDSIAFAQSNDVPVYIIKNHYINSDISVPSRVRITGISNNEFTPWLLVGDNCSTVLTCTGICNYIENIGIKPKSGVFSLIDAIKFNGNTNGEIDSYVDNVHIAYMRIALTICGRNVLVKNCGFSHCQIGVDYQLAIDGARGLQVENCRFHGIGEEADLDWFENSYGIRIENNTGSHLTVRNNLSDQGGTFFYGYASNALIENNFIESFAKAPIVIKASSQIVPQNNGAIIVQGNYIKGKSGQVATDVTVDNPTNLVVVDNLTRVKIESNSLARSVEEFVAVNSASDIIIDNNLFQGSTSSNAVKVVNSRIDFYSNIALNSVNMVTSDSASTTYLGNNVGFSSFSSDGVGTYGDYDYWVQLGTIKGDTPVSIALPKEFLARTGDGKTCFHCCRYGNYITSSVFYHSASEYTVLSWDISGTTITPKLRKYNTATPTSPQGLASSMTVFVVRN